MPARFCWVDLGTPDGTASLRFYGRFFDWEAEPLPIATPGGINIDYRLLRRGGSQVAGFYEQVGEQRDQGQPSRWLPFVGVDDVEAVAPRAVELGARLAMRPTQVYSAGRMALLDDPQGAAFGLWQGHELAGFGRAREPGLPAWFELASPDPAGSSAFYAALLGWEPGELAIGDEPYRVWRAGGEAVAGIVPAGAARAELAPQWLTYFVTGDLDAATTALAHAGEARLVERVDVPGVARAVVAADPHGASFGLYQIATAPVA